MYKGEFSTQTLADALKLGFTVWSPDTGTHKLDGSTLKNKDSWWKRLDIPQEVRFLKSETKMAQMGDKFEKAHVLLLENYWILLIDWALLISIWHFI